MDKDIKTAERPADPRGKNSAPDTAPIVGVGFEGFNKPPHK